MPTLERLTRHYDTKYAASDFTKVEPVRLVRRPKDRSQAAVFLGARFAGGSYLEIGAGAGGTILALGDRYDHLVGTELSAVRARELQHLFRNSTNIEILQNNLEDDGLPFGDEEFDTVSMIAVIEHLFDPIGALRECHRVLKPGGRLIVETPNIAKWTRRIKLLFGYFPSTASVGEGLLCYDRKTPTDLHDEGHLHYFTFRALSRLAIERAGFRSAEIYGHGVPLLSVVWPQMFSDVCVILYR